MSDAYVGDDIGPRPGDSPGAPSPAFIDPAATNPRPTLGRGYDFLLELFRQLQRPGAWFACMAACYVQIFIPALRMDFATFSLFIALLTALCGMRTFDVREIVRQAREATA